MNPPDADKLYRTPELHSGDIKQVQHNSIIGSSQQGGSDTVSFTHMGAPVCPPEPGTTVQSDTFYKGWGPLLNDHS